MASNFKFEKPYCSGCGIDFVPLTSIDAFDTAGASHKQWICERCFKLSQIWQEFVDTLTWVTFEDPEED